MKRLFVFDLDGTLVVEPCFYRTVYSGALEQVILSARGQHGLDILQLCRRNLDGRGELALFALGIPFKAWADQLNTADLRLITPQPLLVKKIRLLRGIKVVYTGSPALYAKRVLERIGFSSSDFAEIIGWREPERYPLKWSCASLAFRYVLHKYQLAPHLAWSIGDVWETDLQPAQCAGLNTARIGGQPNGETSQHFADISTFVDCILRQNDEQYKLADNT